MTRMTRREALGAGMAAAAIGMAPGALAEAPMSGVVRPSRYTGKVGDFEVTTILDGVFQFDGPHPIFGQDRSPEEVAALMAQNNLPSAKFENGFAPVALNTGSEVILFDTGLGAGPRPNAGLLSERLTAAGIAPEQVDIVVLTHFHPDHIGGLMENGAPTFPNARYVASAAEYDFWSPEDKLSGPTERVAKLTQSNIVPLADKMTMISDGEDVVTGVTAVAAHGHTPGHTVYHVESAGRRLLIAADTANHYVASLQRPDWHVRFDMDKEGAAATRKKIFGMVAADGIPFAGYHMPFPAVGYVEEKGEGFRYVPAAYQLNL